MNYHEHILITIFTRTNRHGGVLWTEKECRGCGYRCFHPGEAKKKAEVEH